MTKKEKYIVWVGGVPNYFDNLIDAEIEKKELQTADDLTKKYGKGNLNIDTGEFTPSE